MAYTLLFIFISILFSFETFLNISSTLKKNLLKASLISYLLFFALRWRTGTDWPSYYGFFKDNFSLSDFMDSQFEIGYVWLNFILKSIYANYTFFLLIFTGCITYFYFKTFNNVRVHSQLAILYLFSTVGTPIRQTLSVAIIMFAYKYVVEKRILKFLIFTLIASLFHRSALIFLPFYFLLNIKISDTKIVVLYFLSILIGNSGILNDFVLNFASSIIFNDSGSEVMSDKLTTIFSSSEFVREISLFSQIISLSTSFAFIIIFLWTKKKYFERDVEFNIYFKIYIFGLILSRLFIGPLSEFARFNNYFSGATIFLFSLILLKQVSLKKTLIFLLMIVYSYSKLVETHSKYPDLYYPYLTIFETERVNVY